MINASFWSGRRVLVTGHTGFKGAWLCEWLTSLGSSVTGFALPPAAEPNLFTLLGLKHRLAETIFGDIRDRKALSAVLEHSRPEVVFHLASQAIVRRGVAEPFETFSTNVLGLVNVLDATRSHAPDASFVNVTSDKVYANDERGVAFRESDPLGGDDPYSASKACAELVTKSYRATFRTSGCARLASARAGNVIGGGDWAEDRLIPDMIRSMQSGATPLLRNPGARRPWQHVLEPLSGYLLLAERLGAGDDSAIGAWNFGPQENDLPPVHVVAETFLRAMGHNARWCLDEGPAPREKGILYVDSSEARSRLNWRSRLLVVDAVEWTAQWYENWLRGTDVREFTLEQIRRYESL